ncbi:MAG: methyltransferase [Oscillospiraceae bacterium]|jgi:hypothetical protein|nr:methyltransferase [Oscillospiraceae bacterium]
MAIPKFDPKELTVAREAPSFTGTPTPIYSFPVTMKEGVNSLYKRQPIWQPTGVETGGIAPRLNPDNVARATVIDATGMVMNAGGGPDMFGIEWEFIPSAGGSMVRPGKPFLEDANDWYDKLKWPDVDAWDWESSAKANEGFLSKENYNVCFVLNGWFERLISFMDFEGAAMAMLDDDQRPAVKELFLKLSDLYIKILGNYLKYYDGIDEFCIHDDWGSQRAPFFSPELAAEVIVPAMRKITDWIHAQGKNCQLHSCGQLFLQVPNIIAAGWDTWSGQVINDTEKIYDLYGDKLIIGVVPEQFDPSATSEEQQRAYARDYADKFCRPDKPSVLNVYGSGVLTPAFREELYVRSRENYSNV